MKKMILILMIALFTTNLLAYKKYLFSQKININPKLSAGLGTLGLHNEISLEINEHFDITLNRTYLLTVLDRDVNEEYYTHSLSFGYKFFTQSFYGLSCPLTLSFGLSRIHNILYEEIETTETLMLPNNKKLGYENVYTLNSSVSIEPRIMFLKNLGLFIKIKGGLLKTIYKKEKTDREVNKSTKRSIDIKNITPIISFSLGIIL